MDAGAAFTGGAADDTFNATASTFTAGDVLDGGAGIDTLSIADNVAGMGIQAPSATLTSVEKLSITTSGRLGVAAVSGTTAVAQVNKYTIADPASSKSVTVYYGSLSTTVSTDADATKAEFINGIVLAINGMAGSTVAAAGTGADDGKVVVTAPVAGTALPVIAFANATDSTLIPTASVVATANVVGVTGVSAAAYDVSNFSSLTDVNVTTTGAANLKASATANVVLTSGAGVTLVGGLTQNVTAKGGFAVSGGKGAITVVDSAQGAVNSTVDGGTSVAITSTAKNAGGTTGTITVGGTTAPTGDVTINSTISEPAGTTSTAGGAIAVTGGAAIVVNQVASKAVQTTDGATNGTITNAAVSVTGAATTTSVTAKASAAVTAVSTTLAVAAVTEVATLTFTTLANGASVSINGLQFTNTSGATLSAAKVAAIYANLAPGATQGNSTDGYYMGSFSTQGWTTSGVGGTSAAPTVTFTGSTAGARTNLTAGGAVASVTVDTNGVDAVTAAGKTGVTANTVTITDVNNGSTTKAGTITTATAENYTTFTFNGNALSTLSLTGGSGNITIANGGLTSPTNKTLALTVNGLTGGVLDDADIYTTLNVTATGKSSTLADITDTALTALNVAGDKTLTLSSTAGAWALANVTVTGSAGLKATFAASTMKAIDTTGTTGTSTITFDATKATYTGGAGADLVTTSAIAPTKAISLGGGDDKLTLASGTVSVTGAIAGGAGSDTLSMVAADAATADNDLAFSALVTGFEVLELTGSTGNQSVNLANLALTNKVVVGAEAAAGTLTVDGLVSGGTLTINGSRAGSGVTVTNSAFATPTTDSLNIAITNVAGNGNINAGTVTAANVETINISVNDGDQVIPADTHSLVLTADKATTIVITNDNAIDTVSTSPTSATDNTKLNLNLTGSTKVTLIDGSAMTGGLTVTSVNTTSATTIKGGSGDDALTAATGTTADILLGGAGADTLTSNAGLTTLTGGAGNDLFVTATAGANGNVYTTITDATAGDRVQLKNLGTETFATSKLVLAATASFADYLNFATDSTTADSNSAITWFQYGNNTYIVQDVSASADFVAGQDIVVALTGLIDLSKASFAQVNPVGAPTLQFG